MNKQMKIDQITKCILIGSNQWYERFGQEQNKWREMISRQFPILVIINPTLNLALSQTYTIMKYNHQIDFFSSPNSKFIGFSDIRHPQLDINSHNEAGFQSIEQDKKMCRKLSFTASNIIDPIMPFGNDFFQEKLEECDQPEEYSENKHHHEIQENSLMMDAHFRVLNSGVKSPIVKLKEPDFLSTPNTMRIQCQDMPSFEKKEDPTHGKNQSYQNQIYTTPKRKSQFFSARKSCESTAEKSMLRNNQKGLRRLSSLAYSIVSQSTTTTYKEVAEKLLSHLNFNSTEMEDEDGIEKSSMQNVKRRVYDSLNVLLALGVIKRVGSKIAKQKQRKPFTADNSPDLQKYNKMLAEYNERVKALQARKRTEGELKEKLQIFRKTVQRNKKTRVVNKNKLIRLPFLAFVSKEEIDVEWTKKDSPESERKKMGKRLQMKQYEKERVKQNEDNILKLTFKGCPQSYGDFDFFKLLQQQQQEQQKRTSQILIGKEVQSLKVVSVNSNEIEEFQYEMEYVTRGICDEGMNLIDEVFGEE